MAMIIGVTGTFGSGKTTAAKLLAKRLNCGVLDADKIAKDVFAAKKNGIMAVFGTTSRKKIAGIVFSDRKKLRKLNEIIHPSVLDILQSRSEMRNNIIWDVPLLIETEAHKIVDRVVVVKCDEKVRLERLGKKGFTSKEIKQRTRSQFSITKKIKHADFVIDNSRFMDDTKNQVSIVVKKILNN